MAAVLKLDAAVSGFTVKIQKRCEDPDLLDFVDSVYKKH